MTKHSLFLNLTENSWKKKADSFILRLDSYSPVLEIGENYKFFYQFYIPTECMKGVFMKDKLFTRDFSLVVIGQIISLFGNSILRFALPLYLLNETGSASLFGIVTACSFIPMILLSPAGGIVADRINKRNIMVILDYATSALILLFTAALGHVSLVMLLVITLMILYGIQGAYQPAVQASLPALLTPDRLLSGNAVINQVNALANLIGPVAGGALYGFYGIRPILYVSIICFLPQWNCLSISHLKSQKREPVYLQ